MEIYEHPIPGSIRRYTRFARLGLNELPRFVNNRVPRRFEIAGKIINCHSTRMKLLFVHRDLTCKCCGLQASFAAIETCPSMQGHTGLNFYGYDNLGRETRLTWDHILPRSLGGKNTLKNSQTLCIQCNGIKGNELHFREIRAIRRMRGLPIQYEYLNNGKIRYWWSGKEFSES